MQNYFETDLHLSLTSKGFKKFWQGFAVTDGYDNFYSRSESWQEKADGSESKHIVSAPKLAKAKNVGRANEVAPREQAILEIKSTLLNKTHSGYVKEGEPLVPLRPQAMTALSFAKRSHNISYPALIQPKLDGTRMLFNGEVGWTRKNIDYIPDVLVHLNCELPNGIVLDGELMLDQNEFTFQETISAIKKFKKGTSDQLRYYVYDLVDTTYPDMDFTDRYGVLKDIVEALNNPYIILVPTFELEAKEHIQEFHDTFVADSYEGAMVRNRLGEYKLGNRSSNLQKFKVFFDEEFIIIGAKDGVGKYAGCVTWICETKDKVEFDATPKGTIAMKQQWFDDRDSIIGKELTVRHFGYTDGGSLRFPVGIIIRDYEG